MPNSPFRITRGDESLIEFPFTSLSGFRIVFALSYVKLLGWGLYSRLWRIFGLPDIALALSHPHDFYFHELAGFHPIGFERFALASNARRAFDFYERIVAELEHQGYKFAFASEVFAHTQAQSDLQEITLDNWK